MDGDLCNRSKLERKITSFSHRIDIAQLRASSLSIVSVRNKSLEAHMRQRHDMTGRWPPSENVKRRCPGVYKAD